MENCIFCKIIKGEIPSKKIYEDDDVFAFHDVHPAAPVHFMLIPKLHIASLDDVEEKHRDLLGKIILLAPRLAKEQGCTDLSNYYQYWPYRWTGDLSSSYTYYWRWYGTIASYDSKPKLKE
jgi:diadenosine tetraphosphate (Ap4A) HIT family hydrolase